MPAEAQNETVKAALLMLLAGEAGAAVSLSTPRTRQTTTREGFGTSAQASLEGRMGFGG